MSTVMRWSHLERMGTSSPSIYLSKDVGKIASAALDARTIVAAVKNRKNNLQVIAWELFDNGSVDPIVSEEGETTSSVGICVLSEARFVTAARTAAKTLELTVWDFANGSLIKGEPKATEEEVHDNFAIATVRGPDVHFDDSSPGIWVSNGQYIVVTAVRDSEDLLKLISWRINLDGTIERINEQYEQPGEKVREISMAAYDSYPHNIASFATAVTFQFKKPGDPRRYPRLKVISWRIDADGNITQQGKEFGNEEIATGVLASPLCHNCIITTHQKSNGILVIQKWRFTEIGNVIPGPTEQTTGPVTDHSVTTHNTTRAFTATRTSAGYLKIILWDATGDTIIRLRSEPGGAVKKVSIVPLGADWISTLVVDKEGGLKAIAWREHSLSLLHGEWGAGTTTGITETSTEADVPGWIDVEFADGSGKKDPMIAVGFSFVIASQDHGIVFLDKTGKVLPEKYPGEKRALTTYEFFSTFTRSKLGSGGARNENCIHYHMGYSPSDNMHYPPFHACDPDFDPVTEGPQPPCVDEFYDTRVHFDPESRRFFIFAPCRNCKVVFVNGKCDGSRRLGVNGNKLDNPLNRRYFAFAISKTEDPRDGFYQWLSTEAYVADAPEFTVNHGVMVISKEINKDITRNPFGFRPLLYVLSVADLVDGEVYPRSHKFFKRDIPDYNGGELSPLTHYGPTEDRTFLISRTPGNANEINVYSILFPTDWLQVESIVHTKAVLPVAIGSLWQREHPKYRDRKIFFTWMRYEDGPKILPFDGVTNNARHSIGIIRLPLDNSFQPSTSGWYKYVKIPAWSGLFGPDEDYSVEEPTVAVDKNNDMVILYCRMGYNAVLNPEARYAVIRGHETEPSRDELVKDGEFTPLELDGDGNVIVPNSNVTLEKQLDYHTAVIDPHDDVTVWMITEYAKKVNVDTQDGYRTIIRTMKV